MYKKRQKLRQRGSGRPLFIVVNLQHLNKLAKRFDRRQVKLGIKAEMAHTDDPVLAKKIALDHLQEDPNYYELPKASC